MPVYHLSTRINSNVSPESILYDLCIYRMDSKGSKIKVVDVQQQPIQPGYATLQHETADIKEPITTIFIMEVTLYSKSMLHTTPVFSAPFTHMYTLAEFSSGKAWSPVKHENPCFFVSSGQLKPESQEGVPVTVQISRPQRPFIAKEYPIGSPDDPFESTVIKKQVESRFARTSFPNQGDASVCGPAAFFYCLQKDRPDVYAQASAELWQYGKTKIGQLEVAPGDGCRHPRGSFYESNGKPKIIGLDWITLVSLRDSEDAVFSFDALDTPLAGITLWGDLTKWFEMAGYELMFSNVGITQVGVQGIDKLNSFIAKGYRVVTLISDGLLKGSTSSLTLPNHWIVWESPLVEDAAGHVQMKLFSWGEVSNKLKTGSELTFFTNRFFGGVVFKPLA